MVARAVSGFPLDSARARARGKRRRVHSKRRDAAHFPSVVVFAAAAPFCSAAEPHLVSSLVACLSVPVTAKIRIWADVERTVAFARMLEEAGVAALCVHGRRREQRHHEGPADWDAIARVVGSQDELSIELRDAIESYRG